MKCQNKPCYSKQFGLDNTAVAYFHGKKVCENCFYHLTSEQKNSYRQYLRKKRSNLTCISCGKPLSPSGTHYTGLCNECYQKRKYIHKWREDNPEFREWSRKYHRWYYHNVIKKGGDNNDNRGF